MLTCRKDAKKKVASVLKAFCAQDQEVHVQHVSGHLSGQSRESSADPQCKKEGICRSGLNGEKKSPSSMVPGRSVCYLRDGKAVGFLVFKGLEGACGSKAGPPRDPVVPIFLKMEVVLSERRRWNLLKSRKKRKLSRWKGCTV